jgi:hypothetical protein
MTKASLVFKTSERQTLTIDDQNRQLRAEPACCTMTVARVHARAVASKAHAQQVRLDHSRNGASASQAPPD